MSRGSAGLENILVSGPDEIVQEDVRMDGWLAVIDWRGLA
jgi:hypothetical protein